MRLKLILILTISLFLFNACSTKQFIILPDEDGKAQPLNEVGSWLFENPRLIAYKDVGNVEEISNQNAFWVTLEASYKKSEANLIEGDLFIDSVAVIISEDTTWRFPTRVADFDDNNGKRHHKAFNFFGDQSVEISPGVNSVKIVFDAVMKNEQNIVSSNLLEYVMSLEDKNVNLPLIKLQ